MLEQHIVDDLKAPDLHLVQRSVARRAEERAVCLLVRRWSLLSDVPLR